MKTTTTFSLCGLVSTSTATVLSLGSPPTISANKIKSPFEETSIILQLPFTLLSLPIKIDLVSRKLQGKYYAIHIGSQTYGCTLDGSQLEGTDFREGDDPSHQSPQLYLLIVNW